jgi:hypothetical protein
VTVAEPAPRAVAVAVRRKLVRRSRWVGILFCLSCEAELAEVLADEDDCTYLPSLGTPPVREMSVPCRCGAVRKFKSQKLRPLPPENIDLTRKSA